MKPHGDKNPRCDLRQNSAQMCTSFFWPGTEQKNAHFGASHHQVKKVVDLALSLTIDWKKKSPPGPNTILKSAALW